MTTLSVLVCGYPDDASATADLDALRDLAERDQSEAGLDVALFGSVRGAARILPIRLPGATGDRPGLADGTLVALLPAVAIRDGFVRGGLTDPALGSLVGQITEGLDPGDLKDLAELIHRSHSGLLVVADPELFERLELLMPGAGERASAALRVHPATLHERIDAAVTIPPWAASGKAPPGAPGAAADGAPLTRSLVSLDLSSLWRAGVVVIGLVLAYSFGAFVLHDGGSVVFMVVMSWLASIAMEPAVGKLAKHMRRGLATGIVMVSVVLFFVLFFAAFGNLLVQQVANLVHALPALVDSAVAWANSTFNLSLDPAALTAQLHASPSEVAAVGAEVAGGLLGLVAQLVGGFFSLFTIGLFIFYFSADAPRLKRWTARLLPPQRQQIFLVVWDLAVKKTGGYVAARIVLAGICGGATALFLLIIGMDYWLALGIWTGVVAQFVPTIGTYIAIALPVLVGLTSAHPVDGVLALIFALAYQQVENLTIEPKISADAVDMHPAVAFASVLLGAALFGVAGALVAVPVAALFLALFEIYSRTYEILPQLAAPVVPPKPPRQRRFRRS